VEERRKGLKARCELSACSFSAGLSRARVAGARGTAAARYLTAPRNRARMIGGNEHDRERKARPRTGAVHIVRVRADGSNRRAGRQPLGLLKTSMGSLTMD
jgi:hypothetical protein